MTRSEGVTTPPTMPSTDAAPAPTLPDRYTDLRLVARGGMGEVWHAHDSRLDRDVAIKLLTPGPGTEDEQTRRARFEREARVVARMSAHPHVVTIYDIGDVDERPFLAMEWMPGGTLVDRLSSSTPPTPAALLEILEPVASALDAAHADGIVHRDVKPGNVMFDAHGVPRIGDFGIATFDADPSMTLTQAGAVIGTAGYIAPEQASGAGAGPESDQYALMAIAFEGLAGERPFRRDGVIAELAAHVSDPVPRVTTGATSLPSAVDDVFRRGLAKDPRGRYASCTDAIADLRDALGRVPATVASPAVLAAGARPARGRRRLQLAVGGVLALVLLLLAFNAFGDGGDPPATDTTDRASTEPAETAPSETQPAGSPTVDAEPEPAPDPGPTPQERRDAAIALHERSFAALSDGRFQEAYDLGLAALADLGGVSPYEAYANYNVGAALVGLGRCDEAIPYLDRSEQLQGQRDEIDAARAVCTSDRGGNGKGKAKGRGAGDDEGGDGDD